MSVVRRNDGRAQTRKAQSSPYSRPQNSGWSFKKLLEPIRRRVFGDWSSSEDVGRGLQIRRSSSPEDDIVADEPSYIDASQPGSFVAGPPRSPSKTVSPKRPRPIEGSTSHATLENVIEFLGSTVNSSLKRDEAQALVNLIQKGIPGEKTVSSALIQTAGRPLGAIEVEGIVSILRKQMPYERSEPFRFQSATPSRGNTPFSPPPPAQGSSSSTPKKTLSRNPNGSYRWQGIGSAKQTPRRNRYGSPAFGASRSTLENSNLRDNAAIGESSKADGKRRKVDTDHSSFSVSVATTVRNSPAQSSPQALPFPVSSSSAPRTTTNGVSPPKIFIPPVPKTPSRLRTPTLMKPTTPSHPSPLRQAWTGASPNASQEDLSQSDQSLTDVLPPKPTKAANFMSELIKEATPAKKPDLSNPYQTASPVAKVGPPRRSTRRTRATGRPSAPEGQPTDSKDDKKAKELEDKLKDYPAEAIIEATLPKGSKRSRPPAHLQKSTSSESHRSPSPDTGSHNSSDNYIVEEVDDEDRSAKKRKGRNGTASPAQSLPDVVVEEVQTPKADPGATTSISGNGSGPSTSTSNGLNSRSSFSGLKATTAPFRPSKLRESYKPEGTSTPASPSSQPDKPFAISDMDLDAPPPPTFQPSFPSFPSAFSKSSALANGATETASKPVEAKETRVPVDPKAQVLAMDVSDLPVFSFASTATAFGRTQDSVAREEARSKPASSLPTFDFSREALEAGPSKLPTPPKPATAGFNWSGAGIKAPDSSGSNWNCGTCMLSNPDSVADKCTVCDSPRPSAAAKEAPKPAFNWGAAGMMKSMGSTWSCPTCMVQNPESVADKCTACEEPRPGATKPAVAPVKAFDWGAAGVKPPTAASGWTCSTCMVQNPDSAKERCTACEEPRPGAAKLPVAPPKAFDWGAAGLKQPSASGWNCSICMLSNPASTTDKCNFCDSPR
ncbi:hypothetical protein FA15DRAFT_667738 [Coprinopsis marcescibilis]|uniref:RanBP2-type domain-containing protein n=1 Tax=Coprinopsis marcescibilis TaxID=230819 RepID=A0A5C3LCW1_COPMA|nr:hypothetical protein FA15DRAFT_667738 [Coprinopsis marcescibilis]